MNLITQIDITKSDLEINHQEKVMMFGSCFSENIGNKLMESKFKANVNPFGILYNPASIASSIDRLLSHKEFEYKDLMYHNEVYLSFMHHGSYSSHDKDECLSRINEDFLKGAQDIKEAETIIFTFGTAYTFKLKDTQSVVANCHKYTANHFIRERLSVEEIVKEWTTIIDRLLEINPKLKFIFTVSPIRHWKDGAHENTISKSILHLAIDQLTTLYNDCVTYFPAYEILMDELRDYRFYADDMIHPTSLSVDYIWQKFEHCFFSQETININKEWIRIRRSIYHRPLNEGTESYKKFLMQTMKRAIDFSKRYSFINCESEISHLKLLIDL